MKLRFEIEKQHIRRADNERVVEGSKNYLSALFSFLSDEWAEVTKTAVFTNETETYNVILDDDGTCMVPWEIIKEGKMQVSVFGGDLITVNTADVKIWKSGYKEGETPQPPTPDVYQQIMAKLEQMEAGEVSPEEIANAVEAYMADHPVESLKEADVEKITAAYVEAHKADLKGDPGESPTLDITKTGTVTTITITDPDGTKHTATINDGEDGDPGTPGDPGDDGFSPTVAVTKSGKVTTVTITDKNGTHTATINDGADGAPGAQGTSVTHSWDGTTLTVTSASGTSSADLKGENGKDLTHLYETVDCTSATSMTYELQPNTVTYFNGSMTDLTLTFAAATGYCEYNFVFSAGADGCNLSLPETVIWDGGTAPTLSASTAYEVSIDGMTGLALISSGVSV